MYDIVPIFGVLWPLWLRSLEKQFWSFL